MVRKAGGPSRNKKLENLIKNHSMIFMGMFEEAFATIAEAMTETMTAGTASIVDALGGSLGGSKKGKTPASTAKDGLAPHVRVQIGQALSGIREELESQWPKSSSAFRQYISSPAFDKGIRIVDKYDFKRPKLTEELSDEVLASYIFLVQSGNADIAKMFKELSEWQEGLPKPPWGT